MKNNNNIAKKNFMELKDNFPYLANAFNEEIVDSIIRLYPQDRITAKKYRMLLHLIFQETMLSNELLLSELFTPPLELTISSYRKYLGYKAIDAWELHRVKYADTYNNFFEKLTTSFEQKGLNTTLEQFEPYFKKIADVTNKPYPSIINTIKEYYHFTYEFRDPIMHSNASANIKSLIKIFNSKAKINYINRYINNNVTKIKDRFKVNETIKKPTYRKISPTLFLNMILNDDELRNMIKVEIVNKLNYTVDNQELSMIVTNITNNKNYKNLEFFHLEEHPLLEYLEPTKSFNRMNENYLKDIRKLFNVDQLDLINKYLTTSLNDKQSLKSYFTIEQLTLLEKIIPIMRDANATLIINKNNDFEVSSRTKILTLLEEAEVKKNLELLKNYRAVEKTISKLYYSQCKLLNIIMNESNFKIDVNTIPFTDDNFELKNNDYLYNFNAIAKIIMNINPQSIKHYSLNDTSFKKLKKLLVKEGLLACILASDENPDIIINIINNLPSALRDQPNLEVNIGNLSDIVKKTQLSSLIDDETINLLGNDVAKKIAYDTQFLQGKDTPEKIKERLNKAKNLMKNAEKINMSAIPYFNSITHDNVTIERYNNNDPEILTSGIDSNTCFKISANDNDYVFYSVLNKNGMVCRFISDDKMIGRITAHRLSNVLLINGVRTVENDYNATSLNKLKRNNSMINTVVAFANKMIELTTDSDCPIDFVVSNKAGILESPTYNDTFTILPEHLFTNPIDTYNDDFHEFAKTYKNNLQEVPYYEGGLKAPFTTDFGHYPVVLIASRDNKNLERKWDITVNSPEAIYPRPNKNKVKSIYNKKD